MAMAAGVSLYDRASIRFQATDIDNILKVVRVVNVVSACVLMAIYPLGFASGDMEVTAQRLLLCVYSIMFSLLLLAFETRVGEKMKLVFKRMFGFMYSFTGRTAFLLFISSLALAAKWEGCTIVGIFGVVVSCLNCYVVYNHPAFVSSGGDNPDAKQEEVLSYIQQHPELLRSAMAQNGMVATPAQPEAKQQAVPVALPVAGGYVPPAQSAGGHPEDDPFNDMGQVNIDISANDMGASDPFAAEAGSTGRKPPPNPMVAEDHDPFAEKAGGEAANNPFNDALPDDDPFA